MIYNVTRIPSYNYDLGQHLKIFYGNFCCHFLYEFSATQINAF